MGKTRSLNAILFADIAGYTSIMQLDESKAQKMIQKFQNELKNQVNQHNGRIVNFMGDGCLCVFTSSVNALECALKLQQSFMHTPKVPVRIGVHSGDVYFENNSVFGDSVNVASRIESIGIPGAILFSERIKNDILNHPLFKFQTIGKVRFKNISRPINVYALANEGLNIPNSKKLQGKLQIQKKKKNSRYLAFGIIILFVALVAIYFSGKEHILNQNVGHQRQQEMTVAVMEFKNNTGNGDFDILSQISADRFINGVSQLDLARVISGQTIKDYDKILIGSARPTDRMAYLSENFGVNRLIEGQIFNISNHYYIDCTISDPSTNEVITATPTVKFESDDPMVGIEEMRNHILSFLMVEEDRKLNLLLETTPPKYEAYKALLLAKATEDDVAMIDLLNKAISLDSSYFEPKVLRIGSHYNLENFSLADSLTRALEQENLEDPRQKNLLNFYKALMAGQNNLVYQHFNEELNLAPFDLMSNNSAMVLATDFINDVQKAIDIYEIIDESKLNFSNCVRCRTRIYIKMYMDLEIGDTKNALRLGKILAHNGSKLLAEELRIRGWVRGAMGDELNQYIDDQQLGNGTDRGSLLLFSAKECAIAQKVKMFNRYRKAAIESCKDMDNEYRKGEIFLMNHDYQSAINSFQKTLRKDSLDIQALCMLSSAHYLHGSINVAENLLDTVDQMRKPYQFGTVDYYMATAYSIIGKNDIALQHLQQSIAQGQRIGYYGFHNDYWLIPLKSDPEFERILNYWKNL